MSDYHVQQYYRDRSSWPPTDGFKVVVDGKVEMDADTLLEAVEYMGALFRRLENLDTQQEFNLTENE